MSKLLSPQVRSHMSRVNDAMRCYCAWPPPTVEIVEVVQVVRACRDPKDDKFLEVAVNGRADVIVSDDGDLLALNPFRGIAILAPSAYLDRRP